MNLPTEIGEDFNLDEFMERLNGANFEEAEEVEEKEDLQQNVA